MTVNSSKSKEHGDIRRTNAINKKEELLSKHLTGLLIRHFVCKHVDSCIDSCIDRLRHA